MRPDFHRCQQPGRSALPGDAANLYVILSARGLGAPTAGSSLGPASEEAAAKLRTRWSFTVVVSPYVAGGRVMAASALRPLALDFMDLLAGSDFEIEEFRLSNNPQYLLQIQGRSLAELELGRRSGAMVLAIREQGRLIANPGGHMQLAPGQLLIVLGSKIQLSRYSATCWAMPSTAIETMPGV